MSKISKQQIPPMQQCLKVAERLVRARMAVKKACLELSKLCGNEDKNYYPQCIEQRLQEMTSGHPKLKDQWKSTVRQWVVSQLYHTLEARRIAEAIKRAKEEMRTDLSRSHPQAKRLGISNAELNQLSALAQKR